MADKYYKVWHYVEEEDRFEQISPTEFPDELSAASFCSCGIFDVVEHKKDKPEDPKKDKKDKAAKILEKAGKK